MTKTKLLIVDDDPCIREVFSYLLAEIGYRVRTAEDGFSALAEIRKEVPDVLLSDLNMPGMSGFELLLVVRSRFPAIQAVAMSSLFSRDEVPSSVVADAYYQKGSGVGLLLEIMQSLQWRDRVPVNKATQLVPLSSRGDGHGNLSGADVAISKPPIPNQGSLLPFHGTSALTERPATHREAQ